MDEPKSARNRYTPSWSSSAAPPTTGCPKGATGGALMIYASGVDEAEAVRETVAILKQAGLAPLDVEG